MKNEPRPVIPLSLNTPLGLIFTSRGLKHISRVAMPQHGPLSLSPRIASPPFPGESENFAELVICLAHFGNKFGSWLAQTAPIAKKYDMWLVFYMFNGVCAGPCKFSMCLFVRFHHACTKYGSSENVARGKINQVWAEMILQRSHRPIIA